MEANKILDGINKYIAGPLIITIAGAFIWSWIDIAPKINRIEENIEKMEASITNINNCIENIEDRYTKKDIDGVDCTIGVSADLEGNFASVYEGNKHELKGTDIIYITNPYGKFSPTIKCMVSVMERDKGVDSKADVFLSKEALERLDINKKQFSKGVFKMKLHISQKDRNK